MHLLIDTAFDRCQVGLWHDDSLYAVLSEGGEARHDVLLAPLVAKLLADHDVTPRDLTGVAVVTGPGRFTSLRVGIAFARALILPRRLPLAGIATGDILRRMLPDTISGIGWLVMVKRGEVFVQTPAMADPVSILLDALPGWLADQRITQLAAIGAGVPVDWPSLLPENMDSKILTELPMTILGQLMAQRDQTTPSAPVRPFYGQSTGAGF